MLLFKRMAKWVALITLSIMLIGVGVLAGRWTVLRHSQDLVASVSGQSVSRYQLNDKLKKFENRALELLCYELLVKQEATRQNLANIDNTDIEELTARVSLAGVSEEYLRRVHSTFLDQLKLYDIEACCLRPSDAATFRQEFASGRDFVSLAKESGFPIRPEAGYSWSKVNSASLEDIFGPAVADAVAATPVGTITPPLVYGESRLVIHVKRTYSSYVELKGEVERVVGQSRTEETLPPAQDPFRFDDHPVNTPPQLPLPKAGGPAPQQLPRPEPGNP